MNSPTRMRTSVIFRLGIFTDRSANCIVTLVGRRSPSPSCWYTEKGSRLILPPRSSKALFVVVCPMIREMVRLPGFLYFTGMGPVSNSLMFDVRKTFFGTFIFLFLLLKVHLEGGWIGVNANLRLNANSNALKAEANASVGQTNTIQQV